MFHVKPSMYKKRERYGTFVCAPYCSPLFLICKITCLIFPASDRSSSVFHLYQESFYLHPMIVYSSISYFRIEPSMISGGSSARATSFVSSVSISFSSQMCIVTVNSNYFICIYRHLIFSHLFFVIVSFPRFRFAFPGKQVFPIRSSI